MDTYFRSLVWEDVHGPTLRLYLKSRGGTCLVDFFDVSNSSMSHTSVRPGESLACVVQLEKVWMAKGGYGLRLQLLQAKSYGVDETYAPVDEFEFDISDDEL